MHFQRFQFKKANNKVCPESFLEEENVHEESMIDLSPEFTAQISISIDQTAMDTG